MAQKAIKILGLAEFQKALGNSSSLIKKKINEAIKRSAFVLLRDLKTGGYVPVRTGFLRQSIKTSFTDLVGYVIPMANYAIFVHAGKPFLKTAVIRKKAEVYKEFEKSAEDIVKKLAK